ncbi:unnamed protein product [Paramecium sonneborni]|uniref:Uncharacterized protein n=1 Tax=Paramecium sonneborni TaxID=65129 RepID=A0A8S1Q6V0_9CILI|nr:unnamed protein product [Paramecium sonneborni]
MFEKRTSSLIRQRLFNRMEIHYQRNKSNPIQNNTSTQLNIQQKAERLKQGSIAIRWRWQPITKTIRKSKEKEKYEEY